MDPRRTPQANPVELDLDLYEPVGDVSERRPAVIWVHGGGFGAGSRHNPKIVDLAETFARRGYVTAAISYRLLADPPCSQQEAGIAGVRGRRARRQGRRAGRRALAAGQLRRATHRPESDRDRRVLGRLGGLAPDRHLARQPGRLRQRRASRSERPGGGLQLRFPADVANMITPGDAPAIFFHGTRDNVIPIEAAQATHAALLAAGVPSESPPPSRGPATARTGRRSASRPSADPSPSCSRHLRLPLKRRCDVLRAAAASSTTDCEGTEFGDLMKGGEGDDRLRGLGGRRLPPRRGPATIGSTAETTPTSSSPRAATIGSTPRTATATRCGAGAAGTTSPGVDAPRQGPRLRAHPRPRLSPISPHDRADRDAMAPGRPAATLDRWPAARGPCC